MSRRLVLPAGPELRLARLVGPADADASGALRAEGAMRLIDEAASIAAARYAGHEVIVAHLDALDFHAPLPVGSIASVGAWVVAVGRTSMEVAFRLDAEDRFSGLRSEVASGSLVLVAVDQALHPIPLSTASPLFEHPI